MAKSNSAQRKALDSQKLKLCMCQVVALSEGSIELDSDDSLNESDRRELIVTAETFISHVREIFWSGMS